MSRGSRPELDTGPLADNQGQPVPSLRLDGDCRPVDLNNDSLQLRLVLLHLDLVGAASERVELRLDLHPHLKVGVCAGEVVI